MLLWLMLSCPLLTNSMGSGPAVYSPHIFSSVIKLPDNQRVLAARIIYKATCRKMRAADAMKSLNDLTMLAKGLDDRPLECAVYDMRADYYSVNRGFNPLSTRYADEAIAFAQKENMQLETGIYQHRKAIYYFVYKKNTAAIRYFLLSQENFRAIGFDKVPGMGTLFWEMGNFYYSLGDLDNARSTLRKALTYQPTSRDRINILNTIALTYRNSGRYDTAIIYFKDALQKAKVNSDSVWIGITRGNIGSVYFLQHQYDHALPLIQADYRESLKYNQVLNAAIAMLRLVKISIDGNDLKLAAKQLDTAHKLLSTAWEEVLAFRVDYYSLKALLYEKTGNTAGSIVYYKRFEQARDSLTRRDNFAAIERVRLQWETDKSREELNRIKTMAELNAIKQNSIIAVLVLMFIISLLLFNRQRLAAKKDKELLASEKKRLDEKLKNAILALHGYTENLKQKNILIDEFKTELEKLQVKFSDTTVAANLDKMMQAHIMTDENWNEFKNLFNNAHPTFFYNIRHQFGHLTGTDIRLLALIKLRLNNREMAGMLGITVDGVKKSKTRLRKKIGLADDVNIDDIVFKL